MTQKLTPEELQERKDKKDNIKKQYNQMIQNFLKQNPIYYDTNRIYWSWDWSKRCYNIVDDITIMNKLTQLTGLVITKSDEKTEFLETVRQAGRLSNPKELPVNYIQFKDCVIDINTGDKFQADPEYMYINPLPHNLGESETTPIIDKLFKSWVGTHSETLYEVMAYCLYNGYPIHRYFVLFGKGRNGKGQFTKMLERFLNKANTCTVKFDRLLSSRFESGRLFKKTACLVNETSSDLMKKTDDLKALTGEDEISMEVKGGKLFEFINYAKIIISTNNLPQSNDKSDGFYSRSIIIDFSNQFLDENLKLNIIDTIPIEEYENLGFKLVRILKELLDRGKFNVNDSLDFKKNKYEMLSEPAKYYLDINYTYSSNENDIILTTKFISDFDIWRNNNNISKITDKILYGSIDDKYERKRITICGKKNSYILNINKNKIIYVDPDVNPFGDPIIPDEYM